MELFSKALTKILYSLAVCLALLLGKLLLVLTAFTFALMSGFHPSVKKVSFTLWVLACVLAAFLFPAVFISWGDFQFNKLIVPLIQLIMFGMGATLLITDFTRVIKMPHAVIIGISLQFLIMPLLGFALASVFAFEAAVAVGIILIGSCPGGVASNVMTFLSKGNVALSVTMTACSTLIAPVMTPFLMNTFAGAIVEIVFLDWVVNILKIIIIPIVIGVALVAVSIIHNICGYLFGYFGARLAKLDESSCRTVALEVGMQNGGMATALAINVLKDPVIALAPAIFGPWMNISGSALATWWSARPPKKPD